MSSLRIPAYAGMTKQARKVHQPGTGQEPKNKICKVEVAREDIWHSLLPREKARMRGLVSS